MSGSGEMSTRRWWGAVGTCRMTSDSLLGSDHRALRLLSHHHMHQNSTDYGNARKTCRIAHVQFVGKNYSCIVEYLVSPTDTRITAKTVSSPES